MEDGAAEAGREGAPQGALVSPVPANIYLHYVLDTWFTEEFAPRCGGAGNLIRYTDAVHEALGERLRAFELELAAEKTAILGFGSDGHRNCHEDGLKRPRTFDFLGFTHHVTFGRNGGFYVGRRTSRETRAQETACVQRRAGQAAHPWRNGDDQPCRPPPARASPVLRRQRQLPLRAGLHYQCAKRPCRALIRRSQRRRLTWARFWSDIAAQLPRARVVHNFFVPPAVWLTQAGSRMV
jgi:hypothetical protein